MAILHPNTLHYTRDLLWLAAENTMWPCAHTAANLIPNTFKTHAFARKPTNAHGRVNADLHISAPAADRHARNHPSCLSQQPEFFFSSFSPLLPLHIPLPDTNPGLKIPFKSTVCRLCFTGRLCYCVITHKQSLPASLSFPSLAPATLPPFLPPSLPLSSAVGSRATD